MERFVSLAVAAVLATTTAAALAQNATTAQHATEPSGELAAEHRLRPRSVAQSPGDLSAARLVGAPVYSTANDRIGAVEDLIISPDGSVSAVVIGVGGFLGIGQRKIALRFAAMHAEKGDNNALKMIMDVDAEALKALPDYTYAGS